MKTLSFHAHSGENLVWPSKEVRIGEKYGQQIFRKIIKLILLCELSNQ